SGSGALHGISCLRPTSCVAVGNYDDGPAEQPVVKAVFARWDGSHWTATPGASPGPEASVLDAVSCARVDRCVAAGETITSHRGVGEPGGGPADAGAGPTAPPGGARGPAPPVHIERLFAISCATPRVCVSVGGVQSAQDARSFALLSH